MKLSQHDIKILPKNKEEKKENNQAFYLKITVLNIEGIERYTHINNI